MSQMNSVVAIYDTHSQAEEAVKELQRSGFDVLRAVAVCSSAQKCFLQRFKRTA